MKIDFNGATREMTAEEIKALEEENRSLESNKQESDISERVKRLEENRADTNEELSSLRKAFGTIKETLEGLRNLTKL